MTCVFFDPSFSSAESSLATECLFAGFSARALFYMYIYIQRCVYIYICSFMCKFRQSVLSTAETTFCLCVAFFVLLHVRYGCPRFLGLGK